MKKFKTALLVILIAFVSSQSFAQGWIEEEDLQVFGNTRSLTSKTEVVTFSKTNSQAVSQDLIINNTSTARLEIIGFEVPAGITVVPKSRIIESKSDCTISITLYPSVAGKAIDTQVIKIKTKELESDSDKISEKVFKIKIE